VLLAAPRRRALAGSLPHCTKEAEAIALVAHCTATLPAGSPV